MASDSMRNAVDHHSLGIASKGPRGQCDWFAKTVQKLNQVFGKQDFASPTFTERAEPGCPSLVHSKVERQRGLFKGEEKS